MKKLILGAILASSFATTSALADGAFMGIESDYSFIKAKYKDEDGDIVGDSIKSGQLGLGVKAGYDFDDYRVYASYGYDFTASKNRSYDEGYVKDKWKKHTFLLGADYTPKIGANFKFLVGAYTGFSRLSVKEAWADVKNGKVTETGNNNFNKTGWVIGSKVGGIYEINANNAVEFGYKADYTKYGKVEKAEITKLKETNHGIYAGYTYKF